MARRELLLVVATAGAALILPGTALAAPATGARAAASLTSAPAGCSAGAHTLASAGSRLYPDTGNGGYASLHTLVHLVYDAKANRFLPGNRVILTERATQCLTSFSLDFERKSKNTGAGPNLTVQSVIVNGRPASFRFVQPIRATRTARTIRTRRPTRPRRPTRSAARTTTRCRRPARPSWRRQARVRTRATGRSVRQPSW